MQAIILAAGMGKRLKELTRNNCKCMVEVNGVSLIERMMRQIERKNLSRIVVVVGYRAQDLKDYITAMNIKTPVIFVENSIYDKTNNIYSLMLAKQYLCEEDTLLFESDLIFEDAVLDTLIEDPRSTLALVDRYARWMDGTCVCLDEDDHITGFVPGKQFDFTKTDSYFKTVNIYKFSKEFSVSHYVPFLEAYTKALGNNEYYEQVLRVISILDDPKIAAKRLNGQKWYEIDDVQDLDIASSMFMTDDSEKLAMLQRRYGGYWRYPGMIDFCYLVNPYFPPKKMMEEIKASFEALLTQYPSGMGVNSLLAAKNFSVHPENIIVGNGAAELIKALMEDISGPVGFIRPTFEEYPNRYDVQQSVSYRPANEAFSYTADDIMEFFQDKNLSALTLLNPDNPTGNYIPHKDIIRLAEWAEERQITLIVDESFVDFAEELDATMICQELLDQYPNLVVMKSISKSYGVPGLRLGVLASGNQERIAKMKKNVAIWNINSFGEYYMQISDKYKKDYTVALEKFRAERARYEKRLQELPGLKVYPSQANYVMVRLCNGMTAKDLTMRLLTRYNIFVKDLTGKIGSEEYLRLAVRDTVDNDKLLNALALELR